MKLNLNDFDKIIFDMDGVITSEYIYWDTAALTIYELLFDYKFYGKHDIDREWCRKNYKEISDTIFCGEKTIRAVKRLGVNTNWDLAYIVFCVSKYIEPCLERLDKAHFDAVCMFIENITTLAPKLYEHIEGLAETVIDKDKGFFKRSGTGFWTQMHAGFQDWFNGFDGVEGLNSMEKPLLPLGDIKSTLKSLKDKGIKLGIGTGRPRKEIVYPLDMWGISEYFEGDMIATYDEISNAESALKLDNSIAKPHPFVFLKAAIGNEYSDFEIINKAYNPEKLKRTLIVGDAPSDLISATAGNFKFLAVLTGVEGENAREYFVKNHADYIVKDIRNIGEAYEKED